MGWRDKLLGKQPSFPHDAPDLEATMPSSVAGRTLVTWSVSGDRFWANLDRQVVVASGRPSVLNSTMPGCRQIRSRWPSRVARTRAIRHPLSRLCASERKRPLPCPRLHRTRDGSHARRCQPGRELAGRHRRRQGGPRGPSPDGPPRPTSPREALRLPWWWPCTLSSPSDEAWAAEADRHLPAS